MSFFRGFHVWELEAVSSFMDIIYGSIVKGFGEDNMSWKPYRNKGLLFPLEKHLEAEDPLLSGFLCLDCCFGEMFDD